MPKISIDCDERYPFFSVVGSGEDEGRGILCEFNEAEKRQIRTAMKAFEAAQDLMEARCKEAEKKAAEDDPNTFVECPNCGYKPDIPQLVCNNCRYPQPGYTRLEPGHLRRST